MAKKKEENNATHTINNSYPQFKQGNIGINGHIFVNKELKRMFNNPQTEDEQQVQQLEEKSEKKRTKENRKEIKNLLKSIKNFLKSKIPFFKKKIEEENLEKAKKFYQQGMSKKIVKGMAQVVKEFEQKEIKRVPTVSNGPLIQESDRKKARKLGLQ